MDEGLDELDARSSDRPLSPVIVLMDPYDSAAITAALLDAHDPDRGRIVVHPTPAVSSAKALGHDLLLALGRPVSRLSDERISGGAPAWQAATAWIAAGDVDQLIVLRAHRLPPGNWEQLLELWRCTGVRLVLVCHDHKIPIDAARLLDLTDHFVTKDIDDVLPVWPPLPSPPAPGPPPDELPLLPDTDFARFRADAYRRLVGEDFGRVDLVYGQGLAAACAWLARHPDQHAAQAEGGHFLRSVFPGYLRPEQIIAGITLLEERYDRRSLRSLAAGLLCDGGREASRSYPTEWGDMAGLQVFLTELVTDSPSRRHTVTRLRGAQAGFLLHGLLLTLPDDLPTSASGPGLTSTPFTATTAGRIRAGVASPVHAAALATALFTGMDPTSLVQTPINALTGDCAALKLFPPARPGSLGGGPPSRFFVPEPARPLLRAARTFLQLRGADPSKRLLTAGIGPNAAYLAASAVSCRMALPATTLPVADAWHTRAKCWWVGHPLHPPERKEP